MKGSLAHWRASVVLALGMLAVSAPSAFAHALVSPPVAEKGVLQQFTLSVPTEKAKTTTTKVELDVPSRFSIDSYEPSPPGWRRQVAATGSGDGAAVQKVTWTGGHVPTEEDAVFRVNASVSQTGPITFHVVQTYADGSVVDWSGPESSDTPAPVVESVSSLGGGGGSSNSTLGVIALVVAGLALVIAIVGLFGRGRSLT